MWNSHLNSKLCHSLNGSPLESHSLTYINSTIISIFDCPLTLTPETSQGANLSVNEFNSLVYLPESYGQIMNRPVFQTSL